MRKISVLLSAFIIALSTISYAEPQATVSGNLDKTMTINGQNYHVVRTIDNNNVSIKVLDKDSKEIWTSIALGFDAWNFKLNGKVSSLEIEDVDGDNIPEIITACTTGDIQSAMYIFKYNPEKKNFSPMNFGYVKYKDMTRDFMVSDIPAPNGENMVFENKAKVRCLGKIYTEDGPVPGYYYFELKNGEYLAGDAVPAKTEENENLTSPVKPTEAPQDGSFDKG
jgi:hypothetical protein